MRIFRVLCVVGAFVATARAKRATVKSALLAFAYLALSSLSAAAAEEATPAQVAQEFYDGYMKVLIANGNTQKYVISSEALTQSFKKAYAKLVKKGMDSDPIICAQDYPDGGFAASATEFKKGKAYVTMKSRGDTLKHSFKVTLRNVDGAWLISDTNDLKADASD